MTPRQPDASDLAFEEAKARVDESTGRRRPKVAAAARAAVAAAAAAAPVYVGTPEDGYRLVLAAIPVRELLAEVERRFGRVAGETEIDPDAFLRAHPDAIGTVEAREARGDLASSDANRRRRAAWILRVDLRRKAFHGPLRNEVRIALGVETDPAARRQLEVLVAEAAAVPNSTDNRVG